MRTRVRDVVGEPLAVRERDHPVMRALSHVNPRRDVRDVEAPRLGERDVVVEPAPVPDPECLVVQCGQVVRERTVCVSATTCDTARPSRREEPPYPGLVVLT